jgi:hypothetical protein
MERSEVDNVVSLNECLRVGSKSLVSVSLSQPKTDKPDWFQQLSKAIRRRVAKSQTDAGVKLAEVMRDDKVRNFNLVAYDGALAARKEHLKS